MAASWRRIACSVRKKPRSSINVLAHRGSRRTMHSWCPCTGAKERFLHGTVCVQFQGCLKKGRRPDNEFLVFPVFRISSQDPYGYSGLVIAIISTTRNIGNIRNRIEASRVGLGVTRGTGWEHWEQPSGTKKTERSVSVGAWVRVRQRSGQGRLQRQEVVLFKYRDQHVADYQARHCSNLQTTR
jgi:hypothetical protein